jgi:hypothetical protein
MNNWWFTITLAMSATGMASGSGLFEGAVAVQITPLESDGHLVVVFDWKQMRRRYNEVYRKEMPFNHESVKVSVGPIVSSWIDVTTDPKWVTQTLNAPTPQSASSRNAFPQIVAFDQSADSLIVTAQGGVVERTRGSHRSGVLVVVTATQPLASTHDWKGYPYRVTALHLRVWWEKGQAVATLVEPNRLPPPHDGWPLWWGYTQRHDETSDVTIGPFSDWRERADLAAVICAPPPYPLKIDPNDTTKTLDDRNVVWFVLRNPFDAWLSGTLAFAGGDVWISSPRNVSFTLQPYGAIPADFRLTRNDGSSILDYPPLELKGTIDDRPFAYAIELALPE